MENQRHSPYRDWYHIKRFPVDAYKPGDAKNFLAWWKFKSLPKFNTDNPSVRQYIFDVARYWIDQGIDGWRLDVPNEIDDDPFWAEFRHVVKSANPDAYLVGEIWKVDPRWVGSGHFDGLMNYPLRDGLMQLVMKRKLTTAQFVHELETMLAAYSRENSYAHYVPLGSHDTPRLLTLLKKDVRKVKLFNLMLFSFPGAPAIYYGDEIGMHGKKDPDCRKAFPWDESAWNMDLRDFIKKLIHLRLNHTSLRRGDVNFLQTGDDGVVAMARMYKGERVLLVFNPSRSSLDIRLPVEELGWSDPELIMDLLTSERHVVSDGCLGLHLPAYKGLLLSKPG
jgi:glycosidase